MNQAHFHILVNHLPIIVPIVGVLVLLCGIIFRSEIVKRVAYFVFIIGAVATLPSMLSGEGAEDIVENIPGVTEHFIHEHEESAETFAVFSYILGLLSLVGLLANWKKKRFSSLFCYGILFFSMIVIYLAKETGTSGGEIRHTEIREGNGQNSQSDSLEDNIQEEED